MYCVIPIFKEPFLHPLHKNNGLSALWVKPKDDKSFFIIQKHPDSDKVLEDFKWLNEHSILTPDKKILNHFYEFDKVTDINYLYWDDTGKPFEKHILHKGSSFLSNITNVYSICKNLFNKSKSDISYLGSLSVIS